MPNRHGGKNADRKFKYFLKTKELLCDRIILYANLKKILFLK